METIESKNGKGQQEVKLWRDDIVIYLAASITQPLNRRDLRRSSIARCDECSCRVRIVRSNVEKIKAMAEKQKHELKITCPECFRIMARERDLFFVVSLDQPNITR